MEEKRIFDLVLVKYSLFLVNCGNILVKSGRFLVFFGIDVLDGPETWLSSGRPSRQPGCRVSALGDHFLRRYTPSKTNENHAAGMHRLARNLAVLSTTVPAPGLCLRGPFLAALHP